MRRVLRGIRDVVVDLRRRKVFRATVVYVVAAAGAVELADILVPHTPLPEGTPGILFVVAAVGLPVVLGLAWAYDVSAGEGAEEEAVAAGSPSRTAVEAAAGGAVPDTTGKQGGERPSLAVLPFENLSGTDEAAPLAAGLHGDLLTALAKVPGLTVISRRSVLPYRDTTLRPAEIAAELDVETLLEGAVQSAAGRVRLNVNLIDARTEAHRWAESYDRTLSPENIFQIQTELARRITESLHAQLGGEAAAAVEATGEAREAGEGPVAGTPPTADLEAYRLHSRGQIWLDHRTGEAMVRALEAFQAALDRDPDYALAWAGVAEAVALLRYYDYPLPDDAPDPEIAARRALELDPDLAEAHTSLGILHTLRHDAPAARDALRRAVELGPGYAEAHIWLAWIQLVLGRPEAALEPAHRALELNPLAPVVQVFTAETLLANQRVTEARERSRRAVELQDGFALAHYIDALVAHHAGDPAGARAGAKRALRLIPSGSSSPRLTQARALLGLSHIADADRDAATAELDAIRDATGPDDAFPEALLLAGLGETDAAFDALARVRRWGPGVTEEARLLFPDVLAPLRNDPRFDAVREAIDRSWGMG